MAEFSILVSTGTHEWSKAIVNVISDTIAFPNSQDAVEKGYSQVFFYISLCPRFEDVLGLKVAHWTCFLDLQTSGDLDELFKAICCFFYVLFFKSPYTSVVSANAAILSCCEAPEIFVDRKTVPDFSLSWGLVDNDWILYFWANLSFNICAFSQRGDHIQ